MAPLIIKGPWVGVLASASDPNESQYQLVGEGFESQHQAETYLRKNHPQEFKNRMAFPFDIRAMALPEHKIGEFKTWEEAQAVLNRLQPGTDTKN